MYSFTLVVLLVWKFALSKEDFLSYFLTRSNLWESPRQSRGFTSINYSQDSVRDVRLRATWSVSASFAKGCGYITNSKQRKHLLCQNSALLK